MCVKTANLLINEGRICNFKKKNRMFVTKSNILWK